jgi:hypothetical protein
MKISVRVKANSKKEAVEKQETGEYTVFVKALPQEGRANEAVIKTLSLFFDVPKSNIRIIRGHTSKVKLIEIL